MFTATGNWIKDCFTFTTQSSVLRWNETPGFILTAVKTGAALHVCFSTPGALNFYLLLLRCRRWRQTSEEINRGQLDCRSNRTRRPSTKNFASPGAEEPAAGSVLATAFVYYSSLRAAATLFSLNIAAITIILDCESFHPGFIKKKRNRPLKCIQKVQRGRKHNENRERSCMWVEAETIPAVFLQVRRGWNTLWVRGWGSVGGGEDEVQ